MDACLNVTTAKTRSSPQHEQPMGRRSPQFASSGHDCETMGDPKAAIVAGAHRWRQEGGGLSGFRVLFMLPCCSSAPLRARSIRFIHIAYCTHS